MKKLSFAIVGAAALALAACGGKGDDALGDNVADNYEAAADNLEAMADNTANGAEADALTSCHAGASTLIDRPAESTMTVSRWAASPCVRSPVQCPSARLPARPGPHASANRETPVQT